MMMKSNRNKKLDPRDRRILLNTCYGHFMSHFNMLVFPALVLPLTVRLGLGMAQVLELSFWMYLLFGLTALFWGFMADRFGARRLLFIFFLGTGLSSFGASLWLDSPVFFAAALAALGAVLIVPIQQAHYLMGADPLLLSFIVVIIGGLGSLPGTVVAAILIGMSDGIISVFFSPTLAKITATLFVALVLVFRPQGLFGARGRGALERGAAQHLAVQQLAQDAGYGNGPIDAAFNSIAKMTGTQSELLRFTVSALSGSPRPLRL